MAKVYLIKCRICKTTKKHKQLDDFGDRLPDSVLFVECLGCGILGVEEKENAYEVEQ